MLIFWVLGLTQFCQNDPILIDQDVLVGLAMRMQKFIACGELDDGVVCPFGASHCRSTPVGSGEMGSATGCDLNLSFPLSRNGESSPP
nr:hypothetical protein HUO10_004106 [Paraburkholderia busanensis]